MTRSTSGFNKMVVSESQSTIDVFIETIVCWPHFDFDWPPHSLDLALFLLRFLKSKILIAVLKRRILLKIATIVYSEYIKYILTETMARISENAEKRIHFAMQTQLRYIQESPWSKKFEGTNNFRCFFPKIGTLLWEKLRMDHSMYLTFWDNPRIDLVFDVFKEVQLWQGLDAWLN